MLAKMSSTGIAEDVPPEPEPEPDPGPGPECLFDLVDPELLARIFGYLPPVSLVRAGLVCREWHEHADDDELWLGLHNKVLVRRNSMHRLREDQLFPRTHLPPALAKTLSVKELKRLIAQRGLQRRAAALREKSELVALVAGSSYPPLSARHYVLPTKWKASFAHAYAHHLERILPRCPSRCAERIAVAAGPTASAR